MSTATRPTFNSPGLREQLVRLRTVHDLKSLGYLFLEYACIAVVLGASIGFFECRASWGLPWLWNLPVWLLAVVLIGGLQHRLAGLGHEAAHYTLFSNKLGNDLAGDLLCMFPVLSMVHLYRLSHMAHHQFPNDPGRDPNIVGTGEGKEVDGFPMSPWRFFVRYHLRLLVAPVAFFRYTLDYARLNMFGSSSSVYCQPRERDDSSQRPRRLGTVLGIAYLAVFVLLERLLANTGQALWLIPAGMAGIALVALVTALLPDRLLFVSPFRQPYSSRVAGILRLSYYTVFLVLLGLMREQTGGRATAYFYLLWIAPMATSFMFFMLLRDVYQHANADDGRLTNTRVFFCDPLTHWAVFVYGQAMHVPHHLFPAVPHHQLAALHRLLKQEHPDYAEQVIECHGTFANRHGQLTILDAMAAPRSCHEIDLSRTAEPVGAGSAS